MWKYVESTVRASVAGLGAAIAFGTPATALTITNGETASFLAGDVQDIFVELTVNPAMDPISFFLLIWGEEDDDADDYYIAAEYEIWNDWEPWDNWKDGLWGIPPGGDWDPFGPLYFQFIYDPSKYSCTEDIPCFISVWIEEYFYIDGLDYFDEHYVELEVTAQAVPVPIGAALLGTALLGLYGLRRQSRSVTPAGTG